MQIAFPAELTDFYNEVGYGFLSSDKYCFNRIMSPTDIADFICNEEPYDCMDKSFYDENEMVFMHLSGEDFLTIILEGDDKGSIMYFGTKIAESFSSFVEKMFIEPNYYMH